MFATELNHVGVKYRSGRYPHGSGEDPHQHDNCLPAQIDKLKAAGFSEKEIAQHLGMSIQDYRSYRSNLKNQRLAENRTRAYELRQKGYGYTKIGEIMGVNESLVRSWLKTGEEKRQNINQVTADTLKEALKESRFIDIGPGTSSYLGISDTRLNSALKMLRDEGYEVHQFYVDQLGTDYKTTVRALCPPGTTWADVVKNKEQIGLVIGKKIVEEDGSETKMTARGMLPPVSVDPKRVAVKYAEDGGITKDGVMLLRRGVEDLTLGDSRYAQVRVLVGDNHYLKGMAMYGEDKDFPPGVDILFNTNKTKEVPMLAKGDEDSVLKKIKKDEDNPFGATVAQFSYTDSKGAEHQSPLNLVHREGDWADWKKTLPSQLLSKQPVALAKQQLDLDYLSKKSEYDEIMALDNPTVRRQLLRSFADDCDASAVHLKAAAMRRQSSNVILPFDDIKPTEIYAPNFRQGEPVVLVRFPHGGRFEMPQLIVNNKIKSAKKAIEDAIDAVGINYQVAEQLSGADFDGDTVLVIPNRSGALKTMKPLTDLKDFDPKIVYKAYDGMPKVGPDTGFHKQDEMGMVSNLITDMTIKGAMADPSEIARAVKHSMVVIDAEKHNLDWRRSYEENRILELKQKYQMSPETGKYGGASTLISRAKSPVVVPHRSMAYKINQKGKPWYDPSQPEGAKIWRDTGETYKKKVVKTKIVINDPDSPWYDPSKKTGAKIKIPTGEIEEVVKERTSKSTRMAEESDARKLSSGSKMEEAYADYANSMKSLANKARLTLAKTPTLKYNPSAKKIYQKEVDALNYKLEESKKNKPLERIAQIRANVIVASKKRDNPDMDYDELKKVKSQVLKAMREQTGAKRYEFKITPKEWEAIQAGAITDNKLQAILMAAGTDQIRAYATPKQERGFSASQLSMIKTLKNAGYTQGEIADRFGVSVGTIREALKK